MTPPPRPERRRKKEHDPPPPLPFPLRISYPERSGEEGEGPWMWTTEGMTLAAMTIMTTIIYGREREGCGCDHPLRLRHPGDILLFSSHIFVCDCVPTVAGRWQFPSSRRPLTLPVDIYLLLILDAAYVSTIVVAEERAPPSPSITFIWICPSSVRGDLPPPIVLGFVYNSNGCHLHVC